LIGLLDVLVRPHIWREGRRQGIVRDPLQPVGQTRVAKRRHKHFEREHELDHRA
jgi:hypothetical protein